MSFRCHLNLLCVLVLQALTGEPQALQGGTQLLHEYHDSVKWVVVKFGSRGACGRSLQWTVNVDDR